jgi:predicted HAD superfamily hydrolase
VVLFKKDRILTNIQIENFELISSDIFDTLVYRICAEPSDIFLKVGQAAKKKFQYRFAFSKESYKELRILAEVNARNSFKSKEEIGYTDIFSFLPFDIEITEFLMQEEILQEKKHLMLNEYVYSLLKNAYKQGKKIILMSDMYFSKLQIEELLIYIGVDIELFDEIFISSKLNKTKSKGSMYKYILDNYSEISAKRFLHIGDNYQSDIIQAELNGLQTVHYNVIPENIFSIYNMEATLTESPVDELRSLRKIAGNTTSYSDEDLKWFMIGAQIFGPVYSLFCEWIIDYAREMKIEQIAPLMREGVLFSQLLDNIIKDDKLNITVEPLHVSRKATFLPSLKTYDEKVILELLERRFLSIKDLFSLLLLELIGTEFEQYSFVKIGEAKKIRIEDISLFDFLQQYLMSDEIKEIVRENIVNQKILLKKYIDEFSGNMEFITVDIGGNGTIQTQINNALKAKDKVTHLFFAGRSPALSKVLQNDKLYSWMGYMTNQNTKLKSFFRSPEIIEAVSNIVQAGVSHYSGYHVGNKDTIKAIPNDIVYPEEQVRVQEICWEGIFTYQKAWLKFKKKNPVKQQLLNNLDGIISIFYRLINYPMYDEAKLLGSLVQDDQIHYSRSESIIQERDFSILENQNLKHFLLENSEGYATNQIYWPQGVVAMSNPNYFLQQYLVESLRDFNYLEIFNLIKKIDANPYKCICIYGAGELGEKILSIAKLFNLDISFFIDRNYKQMRSGFHGISVISTFDLNEKIDLIIIASKAFKRDIEQTIEENYKGKKKPTIIGFD